MVDLIKLTILSMIFIIWGYSQECTYEVNKINFNEQILTFYLDSFDRNNLQSQLELFTYAIIPAPVCSEETVLTIDYTFKIYSPEIGLTSYETFYKGETEITINTDVQYFRNTDFSFVSGPTVINNPQIQKIISYIGLSGKLPNGNYLFQFDLKNGSGDELDTKSESLEINRPLALELLSPGGTFSELTNSFTYSTVPLFTWYSDFCGQCTYGIRVCEYNQDEHSSLQNALADWSLLPYDQSIEYHELPWNSFAFQFPAEGHMNLEAGKHYVWQIRRSYKTTLDPHHDYSPINIFEVRSSTQKKLDITDPYLSVIQLLLGIDQFNLWFSTGGELERFVTSGESIWVNGEEMHIDALYSLVSELNQGKITLEKFQIK